MYCRTSILTCNFGAYQLVPIKDRYCAIEIQLYDNIVIYDWRKHAEFSAGVMPGWHTMMIPIILSSFPDRCIMTNILFDLIVFYWCFEYFVIIIIFRQHYFFTDLCPWLRLESKRPSSGENKFLYILYAVNTY